MTSARSVPLVNVLHLEQAELFLSQRWDSRISSGSEGGPCGAALTGVGTKWRAGASVGLAILLTAAGRLCACVGYR